jgi:hypothetical protein
MMFKTAGTLAIAVALLLPLSACGSTPANTAAAASTAPSMSASPAESSTAAKGSGQTAKGATRCNAVIASLPDERGWRGILTLLSNPNWRMDFKTGDYYEGRNDLQVGRRVYLLSNRGIIDGSGRAGPFSVNCV